MKQTRSGFVYLWFDRKHNRYYLGSHWGDENDGYICSSSWMKKAYKLRPDDFKRRIISRINTTRAGLLLEEQRWLDMIKPEEVKIRYYNLKLKSHPVWHIDDNERLTIGQKISKAKIGKSIGPCSPEKARAISEAKKASFQSKQETLGYKFNPDHVAKIVATKIGKPQTPESNAKRSATIHALIESGVKLGTQGPLSQETKRKIGDAHRGMKRTEKTRKNIARANSKSYIIAYTDGRSETVVGLKEYAYDHNLPYGSITSALRDGTSIHKHGIASIDRA